MENLCYDKREGGWCGGDGQYGKTKQGKPLKHPRKNIALWDKKDGRMNWTGIDLDLVMGAVVRGLYFAFDDLNTTNK